MRKNWIALLMAAICGSAGCTETTTLEWPKECVGRMQLALPGEVDQAALLGSQRFRNPAQYSGPSMSFPDGEKSGWGESLGFRITHPLTDEEKKQATKKRAALDEGEKFIKNLKIGNDVVWYVAIDRPNRQYNIPYRYIVASFLLSNSVYLSWMTSDLDEAGFIKAKTELESSISQARPRALFDVPHQPGLCLPYVFIPDDGQYEHLIGMSYRIKEHPDIIVTFESKTAESTPTEDDRRRPDAATNDFRAYLFWGAFLTQTKSNRSLWHLPAKRPMTLAGRPGLETFLAVVYERDKSSEENYVYYAVARGDPDHPEETPDVQLLVKQKRQNAIMRGITPLTEKEVLKLAQQIAASVTVRPVR